MVEKILFGAAIALFVVYFVLFSQNISQLTDVQLNDYKTSRPGKWVNIMALAVFLFALGVIVFFPKPAYFVLAVIGIQVYLLVGTILHNKSLLKSGFDKEFVERQNKISILALLAFIFMMAGVYFVLFT
ncbi:MAG: hypothetical protein H6667_13880 [Ardenticatenaceae bacterium]|nr:hypothetical protein [Ardenticatenaceae bacterium]